jgi:hypothetical protein
MKKMNGGLTMDDEMKIEVDEQIVKSIMAMIILAEKRNLRLPVTQRKTRTQMEHQIYQEIIRQVPKE